MATCLSAVYFLLRVEVRAEPHQPEGAFPDHVPDHVGADLLHLSARLAH